MTSIFDLPALAQKSQDTNVNQNIETDENRNPEIITKFNVASLVIGDLGFSAEYLINDIISFEAGASLLLPYFMEPIPATFDNQGFLKRDMGIGLMGQMRVYSDYIPEGKYFALQYAYKNFSAYQSTINQHSYSILYGYQFHLTYRILAEAGTGIGFRTMNVSKPELYDSDDPSFNNDFILTLSLKIGYYFY